MRAKAKTGINSTTAGCYYAFFTNGITAVILGSLIPFVMSTYSLGYSAGGTLLSAHSIGNLASGFCAGIIFTYAGRKWSAALLSLASALGYLGMILTGNLFFLWLAFLFTGITRGSISNYANIIVAEKSGGSARAINMLHSFFAIGAFLSPFLVLIFTKDNPEHWKISAGIASMLAFVVAFLFAFMDPGEKQAAGREAGKSSHTFLHNTHFWVSTGILFFYLCAETAINGWLVTYFKDTGIMGTSYAQTLASLLWLVILLGRLTCAYLLKFVSKQKILLSAAAGTTAFFILLLATQNLFVITACIIGLGFCMAGIYPTAVGNVGTIIKDEPMAMGTMLAVSGAGAIVMPYITGVIAENIGIFGGMAAISAAVLLNLALSVFNFWNTRSKTAPNTETV